MIGGTRDEDLRQRGRDLAREDAEARRRRGPSWFAATRPTSWHSDDYGIKPWVVYGTLGILALLLALGVFLLVRRDNRQRAACEARGGSWEPNNQDCAMVCTVHGQGGMCLVYSKVCDNHCVVTR